MILEISRHSDVRNFGIGFVSNVFLCRRGVGGSGKSLASQAKTASSWSRLDSQAGGRCAQEESTDRTTADVVRMAGQARRRRKTEVDQTKFHFKSLVHPAEIKIKIIDKQPSHGSSAIDEQTRFFPDQVGLPRSWSRVAPGLAGNPKPKFYLISG